MRRIGVLLPVLLAFQAGVPPALAWTWPVGGPVLQYFKLGDDPYAGGQHRGIDISAPAGAAVVAPAAGAVSFAGTVPGGGRTVTIETADGYSVTLVHLGTVAVGRGAAVAEGETVGTIGPSGTVEVAEPYVHLGIRLTADENGYVDPLGLLPLRAEQPAPDPVAAVAGEAVPGEAVPAVDPVQAVPAAVDPAPAIAGDPSSAEPPAQPQTAAQGEDATAPAAESASTPQVISPSASAEVNVVPGPPNVPAEDTPTAPPAGAPGPQPASPAVSAIAELAANATSTRSARLARSPDRARRPADGRPAPRETPRAHRAPAAPTTPSLARGRAAESFSTSVTTGRARRSTEAQQGVRPAGSGGRLSVANPVETATVTRPGPNPVIRSGAPASVRAVVRPDGGFSAWIVALAAAGALALGACLGRGRVSRARFAVTDSSEPVPTLAATEVEPPVAEARGGEVSEDDLRALERELERLLSMSGTPGQTEQEPAALPQALEWAR